MAANKKKAEVGKGIKALLANIETDSKVRKKKTSAATNKSKNAASIGTIDIDEIEPNPFQPRTEFLEDELNDLATSIETFGVIQPITVRKLSNSEYQLISGERRLKASKKAGLKEIPAYVREADDQAMLEIALLENIQRADLNDVEVALSYQRLIDECSLTHEELSSRLGKKRSSISNHLRVLKLPAAAQKALKSKAISLGHAKILAGIDKIEVQLLLLEKILREGLSVRGTESALKKLTTVSGTGSIKSKIGLLPEIRKIQDQLSDKVGSQVNIKRSPKGSGAIKITFSNDDQFNDIIEALLDR